MYNANENETRGDGTTPLFMAAQNGHADMCTVLLEKNANVNERQGDGTPPLFIAAQNGHAGVCTVLVEKKENVNECKREYGVTPLFMALEKGLSDT